MFDSDKKKNEMETNAAAPDTSPQAEDASTGTAEDVDAIMKKFDRESNVRFYEGVPKKIVRYALAGFSLLMVYMNLFANWDERVRRSLFVGIVILLVFTVFPMKKGNLRRNYIPWYDILLAVLGGGSFFYYVFNFDTIIKHATRISQMEILIGEIVILVLV